MVHARDTVKSRLFNVKCPCLAYKTTKRHNRKMTAKFLIRCSNKSGRQIKSVGGLDPHGKPWTLTESEVINGIMDGEWEFYVKVEGRDVALTIATMKDGRKYVKAATDASLPAALLDLPDCP